MFYEAPQPICRIQVSGTPGYVVRPSWYASRACRA